MFRWCQNCFEDFYWNCIEEKFLFDDSIAAYQPYDDEVWNSSIGGGFVNAGASLESLSPVTKEPVSNNNNNHVPNENDLSRTILAELPMLAPNLYEVFSKSMIFKQDEKYEDDDFKSEKAKPKPNSYYTGVGSKVTFADEQSDDDVSETENSKVSDFEIMFQDEILADHIMSKIEEEEETGFKRNNDADIDIDTTDEGICMKETTEEVAKPESEEIKVDRKIADVIERTDSKSSIKSDSKIFEKSDSKSSLKSEKILLKAASKGILKTDSGSPFKMDCPIKPNNKHLPRAHSVLLLTNNDVSKSLNRTLSRPEGLVIKRVDSIKNLENKNLKNALLRLPQKSASFLSIPDLIADEQTNKSQSHDMLALSIFDGSPGEVQLSKLPDTPVIIGNKLPKFFVETPDIPEYKEEKTLQSMVSPNVIFPESDFSMPRYYGKSKAIAALKALEPVHASKSLPDLHEDVTEKVNKRLVKLRTRLKPLVIRKSDDSIRTTGQL